MTKSQFQTITNNQFSTTKLFASVIRNLFRDLIVELGHWQLAVIIWSLVLGTWEFFCSWMAEGEDHFSQEDRGRDA